MQCALLVAAMYSTHLYFIVVLPIIPPNATWTNQSVIIAGGNGAGNASNQLNYPCGVYVDNDQTIYISDRLNSRVMQWKAGATSGQVVAGGNGQGNQYGQLNEITDVYLDKTTNNLIICDWGNQRVVLWSLENGTTNGQTILSNITCYGVTMDDQGFLYVSDIVNNEVRRYQVGETNGTLIGGGSAQVNPVNQLSYPSNLFVDQNYSVYVSDTNNNRVVKWAKDATDAVVVAGGNGRGYAINQLNHPFGVYVDQLGTVYVSDSFGNRTVRWPIGATQGTVFIEGNSLVQEDQLFNPRGLSFDHFGNCYLVDWGNARVLRYDIITN